MPCLTGIYGSWISKWSKNGLLVPQTFHSFHGNAGLGIALSSTLPLFWVRNWVGNAVLTSILLLICSTSAISLFQLGMLLLYASGNLKTWFVIFTMESLLAWSDVPRWKYFPPASVVCANAFNWCSLAHVAALYIWIESFAGPIFPGWPLWKANEFGSFSSATNLSRVLAPGLEQSNDFLICKKSSSYAAFGMMPLLYQKSAAAVDTTLTYCRRAAALTVVLWAWRVSFRDFY